MRRLLLLVLAAAVPARAAFEDLGAGARAPGMGDAFAALADDVYALHYNPAGLAQLDRPQLGAAYSRLYTGLSDGSDLGTSQLFYARPLSGGRRGTLGFGWDRFALSGLYQEQTLAVGYGVKAYERESGGRLLAGLTAKYLNHSFSPGPEAANALNNLQAGQGADPVLTGSTSKSVPDVDFGLLYRFPRRFQMGLAVQHLTQPNVAFSGSDTLGRAINLGAAYKSIWLSLVGELRTGAAADGSSSRQAILAAERYFPTLEYGMFGLRGSIGAGSGGWQQMTLGGSYRINKIQTDYAYLLPVGQVGGQSGSHRLALTFHFGAPTADEQIGRDLLEQARRLRERGPDYGYEYGQELRPQDLNDPRLKEVRELIEQGKHRPAREALTRLGEREPLSQPLLRLGNRLGLVAYYYPELPAPQTKFDKTLAAALRRFFHGEDRLGVLQASYAYSLAPDARLGRLLEDIEKAVGVKAERVAPDSTRGFLDQMLDRAEYAHTRGDAGQVEQILGDVLTLEPDNATALERLGSLRYLNGRYTDAVAAWEKALTVETRERELESLRGYLKLAKEKAEGKGPEGTAPPALAPAPTPTQGSAPAAKPASAPAPAAAPARRGDPRDIQSFYEKGVEHYARGEYLQASAMFLLILQIDPQNEQARKALDRIGRRGAKP
ncbi:MAG: type IX secretion system membrane protein PorP/SprF [Elusimicrobia bacterium]|nr:type IX secretion system membrane protein PorP/SprF [Elusimicrobiota bacterium]